MSESGGPPTGEVQIRELAPADAAAAAELSGELGYPVAVDEMAARLHRFATMTTHAVFGAFAQERLIGWIDVGITQHLQSGASGEIGGLIVSQLCQGGGVGTTLVRRAEKWIADQQVFTVLVRSQIKREAAHEFYLRRGYSRLKTSAVFTKSLAASDAASS